MEKRTFDVMKHFLQNSARGTREAAFYARKVAEGNPEELYAVHNRRNKAFENIQAAYVLANVLPREENEYVFDFLDECCKFLILGDLNFLKQSEIAF